MGDRRRTPGEKPADRRRPRPEDGVIRRLYWYAWVLVEYTKTFAIGTVAMILALFVGGASGRLLDALDDAAMCLSSTSGLNCSCASARSGSA